MDSKVIEGSRGKILLYLLGSLAFSLGSSSLVQNDHSDHAWKLWFGAAFFGLCTLVFLVLLARPQRLVLDSAGFSIAGGLVISPKTVKWADVDEFFVWRLPRGGKSVGYRYRPDATNIPRIVKVNRTFGTDGALPRGWPVGPDELAAELNAYRRRAVSLREAQHGGRHQGRDR